MPHLPPATDTKQRRLLMEIGKAVDQYLRTEKAGRNFVLLLFDPAKPGDGASYLSNAKRDTAVEVMATQVEKFRGG